MRLIAHTQHSPVNNSSFPPSTLTLLHTPTQPPQNTRFQIDLFWKRNPYLIITFYQYMSFMYAVGASVLLLYGADFSGNVLFITILTFLLSYLLNLGLVSYFMPRFTLCVSVGQLTDRATLNEALSDHRLKKLKEKAKVRHCEERSEELGVRKRKQRRRYHRHTFLTN